MKTPLVTLSALLLLCGLAHAETPPAMPPTPQPTVPERFTLEGPFVRVAYNNEGFVSMGYRVAQEEIGREWILLQVAISLIKPTPEYDLKHDAVSIRTPDGKTIPLATQAEINRSLSALGPALERAKKSMDAVDQHPSDVTKGCALQFFSPPSSSQPAFDQTTLGWDRACFGRFYFHVPGGIQVGQHWLDVKFANSTVQVPFRILTKEEEKLLKKTWDDIKAAHDAAMQ